MEKKYFQFYNDPENAGARIFCFHHAGGSPFLYAGWDRQFPSDIGFFPYQMAGHGERSAEPFSPSIEAAAEEAAEVISRFPDGPVYFTGHSMGGIMAYYTAWLLRSRYGKSISRLFITASVPKLGRIVEELHTIGISRISDDELCSMLMKFGAVDNRTARFREFRRIFLPILRADFELAENFVMDRSRILNCDIDVYFGNEDQVITREMCSDWQNFTAGNVRITECCGGHFFIKNYKELICSEIYASIKSEENDRYEQN